MTNHPLAITSDSAPSGPYSGPVAEAPVAEVRNFGSNIRTYVPGGTATASSIEPASADTGILQSLRTSSGAPADPYNATDKHLVEVNGMQTSVATAIRMGYVARHPATGALVDTGKSPAPSQQAPVHTSPAYQEQPPAPSIPMSRAADTLNETFFSQVPPGLMVKAVNEAVASGYVSERTVGSIATNLQVEPHVAAAMLERVGNERQGQRNAILGGLGVDNVDEFENYLKGKRPDLLREAQVAHLSRGDVSGYEKLASLYFQNLDQIAPERILSADFGSGITARLVGREVILNVPGKGQMSYRGAVASGIINVGGR